MLDLFFIVVGAFYLLIVGLLFVFGVNFYYLTYLAVRKKAPGGAGTPGTWPKVTVQLPVYNEMYVVERLIEAAAGLDYPQELLEIQVLDDSTDETTHIARQAVERLRAKGVNAVLLHRHERSGFKAGALAAGMAQAKGEFLAIFDADFTPFPDFLKQTLPCFQNPKVAFLQTRWSHLNPNYSTLTFLQSLIIDAHFMVEQLARSRGGYWFNFNGTAGVWRKDAIQDAGGWKADTLTEDLDLSYRVLQRGWEAVYLPAVHVPAELPVTFTAYRRQQYRWARGSLEVAQKQVSQVLQAPISRRKKLEAILHLTGYGVHILLFGIALLYPAVLLMPVRYPGLLMVFYLAMFFNVTMFAQTTFFVVAQHKLGRRWWRLLPAILVVSALGAGMMLNTVQAALQILLKKRAIFERTPKFGIHRKDQNWSRKRYQLGLDRIVFFELAFAIFNASTVVFAIQYRNWIIAFYALTFCAGLLFTSGMSILQALGQQRQGQRSSAKRSPAAPKMAAPVQPTIEILLTGAQAPAKRLQPEGDLQQAILRTVAYADVFDYPLTAREVHRYLDGVAASPQRVFAALDKLHRSQALGFGLGVYMLPGRERLFKTRRRRQELAGRMWPQAARYGHKIARLPFVRMVAVTGALAMNNVEEGADIDYLIVTAPGRLWLCRGLVILLVRQAQRQGVILCPNYLLTERALVFPDRSLYAARELAQMTPLSGLDVYWHMRSLNRWTDQFLPNAGGLPFVFGWPRSRKNDVLQSVAEYALRTPPGAWLERWEMTRKIRKFTRARPDQAESDFSADWCKGHFDLHGQKTLVSYTHRLERLEMSERLQVEL